MNFLPRSTWRYAVSIIVLLAFAAYAAFETIKILEDEIARLSHGAVSPVVGYVPLIIWLLTLGFMFLAGALGLWGIRTSVEIESRRRIARLVDAMNFLSDGMVVLEHDGTISGANPAARDLAAAPISRPQPLLCQAFPMLSEQDAVRLITAPEAREVERDFESGHGRRSFRFRSQHAAGVHLIIISDVTDVKTEELRRRQIAQLQLVGRIAAGVAHDFNNILCAVSGHASLIDRMQGDPDAARQSLNFILAEADRGAQLSRQLLELSRSSVSESASNSLDMDVEEAAGLLRVALSSAWTVSTILEGKFPSVPLAPAQIEQVVLNLGLLAADAQPAPGSLTITLGRPGEGHLTDVGSGFAAVIIISAEARPTHEATMHSKLDRMENDMSPNKDESGVIPSVIRSLVEEVGGRLDHLGGPGMPCVYRVCLPRLDPMFSCACDEENALCARIKGMNVLLVLPRTSGNTAEHLLIAAGAQVVRLDNALAALSELAGNHDFKIVVLHAGLMGQQPAGFLTAVARLAPRSAFLVLGFSSDVDLTGLGVPVVALAADDPQPSELAVKMLETAALADAHGKTEDSF